MSDTAEHLIDVFKQLDPFTQAVFVGGIEAVVAGAITMEQMQARVDDIIARHWAGEEIMVSELEFFPGQFRGPDTLEGVACSPQSTPLPHLT